MGAGHPACMASPELFRQHEAYVTQNELRRPPGRDRYDGYGDCFADTMRENEQLKEESYRFLYGSIITVASSLEVYLGF